ncbi:hypothetical protein BJX99DRAFT_255658 [Aspergillus californicus]
MPTLSGCYKSPSGWSLASTDDGDLVIPSVNDCAGNLRVDGDFWLCRDDNGLAERRDSLTKVVLRSGGEAYHVWVEPRGWSNGSTEYGLIVIRPREGYSNRFLEISPQGKLCIVDSWTNHARFRCLEQT